MRQSFFTPGLVIFTGFSEILILGITRPSTVSALILYTPPRDGQSSLVMSLVPTPQVSMHAPWSFRSRIRFSSRSPEAQMMVLG